LPERHDCVAENQLNTFLASRFCFSLNFHTGADRVKGKKTLKLQRFLSDKLAEFLDSKVDYRMRRFTALQKQNLYVGPDASYEVVAEGNDCVAAQLAL